MVRLLLRLVGIKDFDTCKSCETLKQQLELANHEKKELMETLIQLTRPNVVVPTGETKILTQVPGVAGSFGRRRAALENMHRKRDEVIKTSPFIAQVHDNHDKPFVKDVSPQSIEAVEAQLGLIDEHGKEHVG